MTQHAPLALVLVVAALATALLCARTGADDAPTVTYLTFYRGAWGALAGWLLRHLMPAGRSGR
ncbi:hypothetical protein ACWCXH_33890 [Kitasatospora sp. NPDC001660]